ncbi:MAG: tRNA lysidine(34) synthetase TilS [Candidatus Aminicenantes bacterium]|nr:tRNA lysidine(34) synthetase TilS [Candidatus Aminicenantes bacterium]
MRRTSALVSQVRRTIVRHGMIKPGDMVLVACSGGADSTALLHVLNELREGLSLSLAVAHFDHGLRAASGRDARFVHELAAGLSLPFYLEKRDVRDAARRRRLNLEEAGRFLRYDFLRRIAAEIGALKIATGHTLDDQAETVLMRLLRGSGPRGLGGIAPVMDDTVIRPLIEVRRKEIAAFLRARTIVHREDETNRDRTYLRNDVRHRLIPYLEKNFEPAIVEKLGRLAEVLAGEDRTLEAHVRRILPGLVIGEGVKARLNADALVLLPVGLSRRCVRAFIEIQKGDLLRVSFADIENVRNLSEGKIAVLPGGIRMTREGFWIGRETALSPRKRAVKRFQYRWDGDVPLEVAETGTVFSARLVPNGLVSERPFDDTRRAWLDADRLVFPLVVRSGRDGDRYRPLGAPGRQKTNELFRARGVPPAGRGRRPVFESGGEIVWVEGLPVADLFKIGPATRRLFLIEKTETQR